MNKKAYRIEKNSGHGFARRLSIDLASNRYVALMDADDISLSNRFEVQIPFLAQGFDIVGGQISEFSNNPNAITHYRLVKLSHDEIIKDLKKRCPMNQVTVAFDKHAYYKAGGYIDFYCNEDYYLWIRMALMNCSFVNVPNILVNVCADEGMVSRRKGKKYYHSEKRIQKLLLDCKLINRFRYFLNTFKRFIADIIVSRFFPSLFLKLAHSSEYKCANIANRSTEAKKQPFSVCMCVYNGDDLGKFKRSVESIKNQTLPPDEIILVIDGPIYSELEDYIQEEFGSIENI